MKPLHKMKCLEGLNKTVTDADKGIDPKSDYEPIPVYKFVEHDPVVTHRFELCVTNECNSLKAFYPGQYHFGDQTVHLKKGDTVEIIDGNIIVNRGEAPRESPCCTSQHDET